MRTRRSFSTSDRVVAFTRVYQGGKDPLVAVPLRIQLRNQDDFLIMKGQNSIHVCNAPSPAATASLEIGRFIASQVPKVALARR